MKRSKILSSLMALALAITCLAGCGQNPAAGTTEAGKVTTEAPTAEKEPSADKTEASEPVEVTKISIWTGNAHSKAVYERLAEEFNQGEGKELGIEIEYVVQSDRIG